MSKKVKKSVEELLEEALVPEGEQPYEVPDNWCWVRLGSVLENIQYGYTATSTNDKIGPHYLRITDVQNDDVNWATVPFCEISKPQYEKYKLKAGDIVVARTGATTGKSFQITGHKESVFASYLIRLTPEKFLLSSYLNYFMKSPYYWKQITVVKKGSAQPGANAKILSNLSIPLASISEQEMIVKKIESLFSKIEQVEWLIDEIQKGYKLRLKAIWEKAFEGTLYNQTSEILCSNLTYESEGLFDIPKNWKWIRMGNLTKVIGGGTPKSTEPSYYDGQISWITPADLSGYDEMYIESGRKSITASGLKNSSARLMPKGTVLLSSRAPIGYVVIAVKELSTNQGFKSFMPNENYDPEYLYWYLSSATSHIESLSSGSTFKEISAKKCREILVPLPPLAIQKEIAKKISSMEQKMRMQKELTQKLELITQTLKQSILQKAFHGELGTNDEEAEDTIKVIKEAIKMQSNLM